MVYFEYKYIPVAKLNPVLAAGAVDVVEVNVVGAGVVVVVVVVGPKEKEGLEVVVVVVGARVEGVEKEGAAPGVPKEKPVLKDRKGRRGITLRKNNYLRESI